MQLLGDDRAVHLLRETAAGRYREVTSQTGWPTYNGEPQRQPLQPARPDHGRQRRRGSPRKWIFTLPNAAQLQVTPSSSDGVMYVTRANDCTRSMPAAGGRSGTTSGRARGAGRRCGRGVNRGVAVAGDRVFMATDHAHLIALNRATGALLWETEMADWHQNYNGTGAPLVVGNLVISGIAGGDEGVRGFVAAYDQATGKEVWRFWAVPARGRARSRNLEGQRDRPPRCGDVDDRQLRSPSSTRSTGRSAIPGPT